MVFSLKVDVKSNWRWRSAISSSERLDIMWPWHVWTLKFNKVLKKSHEWTTEKLRTLKLYYLNSSRKMLNWNDAVIWNMIFENVVCVWNMKGRITWKLCFLVVNTFVWNVLDIAGACAEVSTLLWKDVSILKKLLTMKHGIMRFVKLVTHTYCLICECDVCWVSDGRILPPSSVWDILFKFCPNCWKTPKPKMAVIGVGNVHLTVCGPRWKLLELKISSQWELGKPNFDFYIGLLEI